MSRTRKDMLIEVYPLLPSVRGRRGRGRGGQGGGRGGRREGRGLRGHHLIATHRRDGARDGVDDHDRRGGLRDLLDGGDGRGGRGGLHLDVGRGRGGRHGDGG